MSTPTGGAIKHLWCSKCGAAFPATNAYCLCGYVNDAQEPLFTSFVAEPDNKSNLSMDELLQAEQIAKPKHPCFYELHAREKAALPEEWCMYAIECFPNGNEPTLYFQVTGAIAPLKTRGKNAGNRDWSKMDKSTKRVVILPVAEHHQFKEDWSKRTGLCIPCGGTGEIMTGWSSGSGMRYKQCAKCEGTGKAI